MIISGRNDVGCQRHRKSRPGSDGSIAAAPGRGPPPQSGAQADQQGEIKVPRKRTAQADRGSPICHWPLIQVQN